jgi:hypothetical protein
MALGLVAIGTLAGCASSSSMSSSHANRTTPRAISLPVGFPKSLSVPSGFYPVDVQAGASNGFGVRFAYPQKMTAVAAITVFRQSLAAQGWKVVPLGTTNSAGPMTADFSGFGMNGYFSVAEGATAEIYVAIGPCVEPCSS